TVVNASPFFSVHDAENGTELWKSDGSEAGTARVKDIYPGGGSSIPRDLTNVNGTLFFSAYDRTTGYELWRSDATEAGTTLVKDINTRNASSSPRYLTDVNGTLFFTAQDGANGWELWKTDGTAAGTTLIKTIHPGAYSSFPSTLHTAHASSPSRDDVGRSRAAECSTAPTDASTVLVSSSSPINLINVNGTLFFTASDINGEELWKSDGTEAGTVLVKDIFPGGS